MKALPPLLILVLLFSSILILSRPASASADEIQALLEFKKGIVDDPSHPALASWVPPPPGSPAGCPSSWLGVTCDSSSGAVTGLSLDGLGLSGDLKLSTLAGLASLRNLSLSGNAFTGRLVPLLGSLAELSYVDLSGNRFYGPIPGRIADLSGLSHLNLSGNNFSQGLPEGISSLQQLRVLDLRSNGLWGDIVALLSELRYPEHVDLSGNGFYGDLAIDPQNVSSLGSTVRYLNLSYNQLQGGFFGAGAIAMFKSLQVLDLSCNRLSGMLPPLNTLYNLKVFRVGSNQLLGLVPEVLLVGSMQLVEVDLSGNGFSGSLPTINSTTLETLNLSSNAFSGPLPSQIGKCTLIDLSKNMLSGDLSAIPNWGNTLEAIDLSSNTLSGSYPTDASQFQNLTSLRMNNNSLSGPLPSVIGSYPKLSVLDLSLNELTGPILPSLFTSLTLMTLNLSGNKFNGTIPLQSAHATESLALPSYGHIEILDLSNNSLSGPLPPEISNLQSLKLLDLANNNLSGELPNEISKLGGLELLDLSNNDFTGRLPDIPQPSLTVFNVSYNDLSGTVPNSLERFPTSSFRPGNPLLGFPDGMPAGNEGTGVGQTGNDRHGKNGVRVALIIGCIGAVVLIIFAIVALYMVRSQELCGRNGFKGRTRDRKLGRFGRPSDSAPTTTNFSNDHLLMSASRSMSAQKELLAEVAVEYGYADPQAGKATIPEMLENSKQPVPFEVYSPDRLAGELTFLDSSVIFTAEDLSHAPAEVLGRGSHGTLYKATLDCGYVLTVKWLRVGLVKHKKEFAKESKRIGATEHLNIISWRAFYWGPKEQERLIISDYVQGDSLSLYLYESTPRRYSRLSVSQRLKIAIDIARGLFYLHHEKGLPHGNLKPTNVLLTGPDLAAKLTDYGLHRLLTPIGTSEQILNLGALGYRAPELAAMSKPFPSFKADVYAFGVILMELLTRKSAGDIVSGQSGAVDLTDWVQMCNREGRGSDCFDRNIVGLEEAPSAMDELLALSLRCVLPANERPNIKSVFEDLCSITT